MACAIQAQWDFVAIREQNMTGAKIGLDGEFDNKLISDFTGVSAKNSIISTFITGTNTFENIHYARVGQFSDDSTFAIAAGDLISDATGLRPARNFDASLELNIYAPPAGSMADYSAPKPYPISLNDIVSHRDTLEAMIDNCGTYDIMMIDSINLICGLLFQTSGRVIFDQIAPDPNVKLIIERRLSTPSFFSAFFDLTS